MTALLTRPTPTAEAAPPVPLRRNRDFQLLWSGRAVSTLGNEVTEIAYPLIMLGVTGSAGYAGMVAAAQLVTVLVFTLPAGLIADRANRRTIMIAGNLARAAIMGALALAAYTGRAGFGAIVAAAVASSFFAALFNPASAAAVKQLVPPSQLPDAMAQNQARMFGAELAGRPLGGWLLGLGKAVPFVFDMLTFLIGAIALMFVRTPLNGRSATTSAKKAVPDVKGMTAGLRHLFGIPRLRLLVLWGMGVNFAFGAVHLMLIATWHRQGMADAGIGALAATIAVGGLLGAFCAGRILRRVTPTPLIIGLAFGAPPLIAAIGFIPGSVPIAVICCVITFFVPALNSLVLTYVVAGTPDGLQGRVSSGAGFLVSALQPLSPLLFGTVFDIGGPAAAFGLMGAVTLVAALATLSRHLRNLPRPEDLTAP